ncbi:MAG: hypothetical protein PVH19_08510 [Planctomycetia bacterium]|jgi:hypothetical protein
MNDCSIHGQFYAVGDFFEAVEKLMTIRRKINQSGLELFCHRNTALAQVTANLNMPQAIQSMPRDKQLAWMSWLTKTGPYWEDNRLHPQDEWLETGNEQIVTDTAIGEAAFCKLQGLERELVSVNPSNWTHNPILVTWKIIEGEKPKSTNIEIRNYWTLGDISQKLESLPSNFDSWKSLETHVRRAFDVLVFSDDAFEPLKGHPYSPGAASRINKLLSVLNELRKSYDSNGTRTSEGNRIYTEHFTGEKSWFSNSSESEIHSFRDNLTFRHPEQTDQTILCSWHGKVKTPQIRIHFSWPISATTNLYIVYIGPKITKR